MKNYFKNSPIFAINFSEEIFNFYSMIAMALKFTQKRDQSLVSSKTYKIWLKFIHPITTSDLTNEF